MWVQKMTDHMPGFSQQIFKGGGYSYFEVLRLRGFFKSPWPFATVLDNKNGWGSNIRGRVPEIGECPALFVALAKSLTCIVNLLHTQPVFFSDLYQLDTI